MRDVFLPVFSSSREISWTKEVLRALALTHPDDANAIIIHDKEDMTKLAGGKTRLCFDTLVRVSRYVICRV